MSVFLVLVATVIAGGVVHFIMKMYRLNEMVKDLPKIPLGLTRKMLTANKTSIDSFHVLEKALGFHNGLAKFWIGPTLAVVCDDPENMKLILMSKNCVDKPYLYRLIGGAGEGIFASHGMLAEIAFAGVNQFIDNFFANSQVTCGKVIASTSIPSSLSAS